MFRRTIKRQNEGRRLAIEIAERLRSSITGQHVIHGVEVTSGASVGIAIAEDLGKNGHRPPETAIPQR